LTDLGKLLGHRFDHATVIHAIKVIEQDIEMNVHDVMLTATELARRLTEHGDNRLQLRLDMLVNNSSLTMARRTQKLNNEILS
jgi:hypothetical protein